MTLSFSAVGVFCEDIREETSGQMTLVGVMPDNVNVPSVPAFIPKLALYVRVHFDLATTARVFSARIIVPQRPDYQLAPPDDRIIAQAKAKAAADGNPFAGVIAKSILAQFLISSFGRIEAVVTVDGADYVCAALNIKQAT